MTRSTRHPPHSPSDAAGPADGDGHHSLPSPSAHIPLSLRVMMALAEADEQDHSEQWREFMRGKVK